MPIRPDGHHPCLNCLYPNLPELTQTDCDLIGVMTPLVPLVAGLQVSLAFKLLIAPEQVDFDRVWTLDAWEPAFQSFKVPINPGCPVCQQVSSSPEVLNPTPQVTALCGSQTYRYRLANPDLNELASRLTAAAHPVEHSPIFIRFSWQGHQVSLFKNGQLLLYGAENLQTATALIDQFVTMIISTQ